MTCPLSNDVIHWFHERVLNPEVRQWLGASATTFVLIGAAEIGDKSQLVCMTMAARHRGLPVFLGALVAFAALNLAAVLFGAAAAHWLPQSWLLLAVGTLFAIFGVAALRAGATPEDDEVPRERRGHGAFVATLMMILLAEFGDKTQLATAARSLTADPVAVWFGATSALALTSLAGIVAGRTVLQKVSLHLLHRFSGLLFLLLAVLAFSGAVPDETWDRARSWFEALPGG